MAKKETLPTMYSLNISVHSSHVDSEGNQHQLFREIFHHRRSKNALDKVDAYCVLSNGSWIPKKATTGWDLEVEWKDGTTSWLPLKELKETNAVEVSYARDKNDIIRSSIRMVSTALFEKDEETYQII
jgi:hypothetical protein